VYAEAARVKAQRATRAMPSVVEALPLELAEESE
jgi:hypothetical protein